MAADWALIPCLKQLFEEFNEVAPDRDHASDGARGDAAHAKSVSDHNPDETGSVPIHDADKVNEVHAIDVDVNLRESDLTMEKVVQFLLRRCRAGTEKRLRYIIYNRRIWSASSGWVQKPYSGSSSHTEHAHFSGPYDSKLEASTASWHLEDIPVALTAADKNWINTTISEIVSETVTAAFKTAVTPVPFEKGGGQHAPIGDAVLNSGYPLKDGDDRTLVWKNLQAMQADLTKLVNTLT